MNEILSTWADAAVRCLAAGSVAAAILAPLAWLVLRATRLHAPVYRHAVWLHCLIGIVALPALSLYGPKLTLPVLPQRAAPAAVEPDIQEVTTLVHVEPAAMTMQAPAQPAQATGQTLWQTSDHESVSARVDGKAGVLSWKTILAGLWLMGLVAMLLRLIVGCHRLQRICRAAAPVELDQCAQDVIRRGLTVRLTDRIEGPVCFGLLRPVILLPRRLYWSSTPGDLRMILTHELAHIDRRDGWANLFQRLLEAAMFFHPGVWLASRQLTHERERICDNWVLARGASVDDYMVLLSDIGERILMKTRHLPSVALFEGGLLLRVRSLLDPTHNRVTTMTRRGTWLSAAAFLLCFAALGTVRLGARPNPGVSLAAAAAMMLTGGTGQAGSTDSNDPSIRPQEEHLGPTGRRPNGNCSLAGQVIAEDTGQPVGHARVYLFSADTHDAIFIRVAADGSFLFKEIAAGSYVLRTTNTAGYQDVSYNPEGQQGNFLSFTLKEGEHRTDILLAVKPAYVVSGMVLNENRTPPARDSLRVVAWGQMDETDGLGTRYRIAAQAPIMDDGSYFIDGLDGRPLYIMAMDFRSEDKDVYYPPCYHPGTLDRNKATLVSFETANARKNVDIRLQRSGEFILEGVVRSEGAGAPIANALVTVHHVDMLFDRVTAYTDEQGRYRIESLGAGEFLVHVDAKPWGFVRKRQPLTIRSETKESRLDFSLRPGGTIRGRFVDVNGKGVEVAEPAYGLAFTLNYATPETSSWSGTRNRYGVYDRISHGTFNPGAGEYCEEYMDFPSPSTFVIDGMLPGKTTLLFHTKSSETTVLGILHNGVDVSQTGIDVQAGQNIGDIDIVIGPVPQTQPVNTRR